MRGPRLFLAMLSAAAALLAMAGPAWAANFTVNSTGDGSDSTLDGSCDDGTAHCTLRAAIQEANNAGGTDSIVFDNSAGVFDGVAANATITLASNLPNISDPVTIDGANCGTSSDPKPCVGITGTGTKTTFALIVSTGGAGSAIHHLDFFNLNAGVFTQLTGTGISVDGSWFGINLSESTTSAGNHDGVVLNTASNTVGGSSASLRNLFAQNDTAGVLVQSGDSNQILGNYFGAKRDGTSAAGYVNNDGIAIFGTSVDGATGNTIGGADTNSNTACDGACNLIVNSTDDGIDIGAQSSGQIGAATTTIKGNYIGLALDGTDGNSSANNTGHDGIDFGSVAATPVATGTTVGGTSTADRNYVGGNPTGIDTHQVAGSGTTVQNNYIGVQPDGTGAVSNQVDSLDVAGAVSGSVQVLNNRIGGNGAAGVEGIQVYGRNAVIRGNIIGVDTAGTVIGFGSAAIDVVSGAISATIGGAGAGEGNVIGGGGVAGIQDSGFQDAIQGNSIGTDTAGTANYANAGPGILLNGSPGGNVPATIGGTTATGENLISNNSGDAIRVTRVNGVEVQRNRGSSNGEQFLDLENPSGTGNNVADGANDGLQAPVITSFNSVTQVTGTAQPNATIRLHTKSSASAGELGTQLATVLADGSGNWTATFSTQSDGQRVAATQALPLSVFPNTPETSELSSVVQLDATPPPTPSFTTTVPSSPGNSDQPAVQGTAEAGSTVKLYSGGDCAGSVLATGTAAQFASPGLTPTTPITHNATTNFRATATDAAGNTSGCTGAFSYVEDSTPPAVTIDTAPPAYSQNRNPAATFHGDDPFPVAGAVNFTCTVTNYGGPFSCASPWDFLTPNLADGNYSLTVTATDTAGNTTDSAPQDFVIDNAPPVTTIDSAPSGTTSDNTPTLAFHATDALSPSTFTCKLDGGADSPCSSPAAFGPLPDGAHTISVFATDAAGNVETPPPLASFTISSSTPPPPPPTTTPPIATTPPAIATPTTKKCKKKKHRAATSKKCKKKKRK
jgi:CSLREA domain-containing protein